MKSLDKIDKNIDKFAEKKLLRVAMSIREKAQEYFDEASLDVSGANREVYTYMTYSKTSDGFTAKIGAMGEKVAFIEFGTGVWGSPYPPDYDKHIEISHSKGKGVYGKGKGKQRAWGFYDDSGVLAPKDISFLTYVKKEGAFKTVVLTQGLEPAKALYRAIRETKAEEEKLKHNVRIIIKAVEV